MNEEWQIAGVGDWVRDNDSGSEGEVLSSNHHSIEFKIGKTKLDGKWVAIFRAARHGNYTIIPHTSEAHTPTQEERDEIFAPLGSLDDGLTFYPPFDDAAIEKLRNLTRNGKRSEQVGFIKGAYTQESAVASESIVAGVGKEAQIETNACGGKQSRIPYRLDLVDAKAMFAMAKVLHEGG